MQKMFFNCTKLEYIYLENALLKPDYFTYDIFNKAFI